MDEVLRRPPEVTAGGLSRRLFRLRGGGPGGQNGGVMHSRLDRFPRRPSAPALRRPSSGFG